MLIWGVLYGHKKGVNRYTLPQMRKAAIVLLSIKTSAQY